MFLFLFEDVEGFGVGGEAVFFGNWVFKNEKFEWHQSEYAVSTEDNKGAKTGKIIGDVRDGWRGDDEVEKELTEENHKIKSNNIDDENLFFGDGLVAVEDARNDDNWSDEGNEFGKEVIGVVAVDEAVVKSAEKNRGEGNLDVFPSAFVNGGKETDEFVVVGQIIEKMRQSADDSDDDRSNDDF